MSYPSRGQLSLCTALGLALGVSHPANGRIRGRGKGRQRRAEKEDDGPAKVAQGLDFEERQ